MKNKKISIAILIFITLIGVLFFFNLKNEEEYIEQSKEISFPKVYLNSLEKDMNAIISNNEISEVTKDLKNSYETSTLKNIITNEKTFDNFLYIGFISYLTDHNESTEINNDSKKEYLGKSHTKVTDYSVSKIYINGFKDNIINNDNYISAIVFELSNKEYLMCQFVRTNNSTIEYDSRKYEQYDVLYAYSIYKDYEDFVSSIQSTKYKIDEFEEKSPVEFNEVMNENREFINNYVDYKLKYYYPNLSVETQNDDDEINTDNHKPDGSYCYPAKPRYLCYEDGRCKCVSSEYYECYKNGVCLND